jgi:hypothetical protein
MSERPVVEVGDPELACRSSERRRAVSDAFFHTATAFFGAKPIAFDIVRKVAAEADQTRSYRQFTDVIDDTIDARVYLGIHFRTPDVQGAEIGKDVARWLDQHFLRPVR